MMNAVKHWWLVKLSAGLMLPLTLWLAYHLALLAKGGASFEMAVEWLKNPVQGFLMALFVAVSFYHAHLGGQEVIVDYVHDKAQQERGLLLYKIFCAVLGIIGVGATLFITFKV